VTILLPVLAFLFVSLVAYAAYIAFAPSLAGHVERRLAEIGSTAGLPVEAPSWEKLSATFKRMGRVAPQSPSEMGKLQRRLVAAGFRNSEALIVFLGVRVACAAMLFALLATPLFFRPNVVLALGAAGLGYLLPNIVLARLEKRRQHKIRLSLPDALDLLVVSVEAGLGLDQAMQRVGEELVFAHPELCEELRLINFELRAGKARSEALHNLGERTGVDDVISLVAMLVQTDKFGTSIAKSLRVHSDTLRTKRRQRAEEAAAKTGVKMVFPLVLCIFPAIWVVTLGPAAIKIVQVLVPIAEQ
jgi:tight adherence protein C